MLLRDEERKLNPLIRDGGEKREGVDAELDEVVVVV